MYISARERKVLELLLFKEEETTVKDLANEMVVSVRTVHRDLKGVEDIVKEYNLTLNKKSGVGIQIVGDKEHKRDLQLFLFNLSHSEYTPEERQTIILSALLEAVEPVKLVSLASDLNVTIATISNDLNKVNDRLETYDLSLIRKRGYGVEIDGLETAKRRAMSNLILENLDEFGFLSLVKENIQKKSTQSMNTITDKLLGLVDKKKLLIIEKQVEEIKNDLPYSIADSAYIGLVVHLTLAVERILQGENINFDEKYLESLKGTKEYKIAQKIIVGLEKVFEIKIPHGEIGYITMHLMGAKLRGDKDYLFEEISFQIGIKAQNLIRYVGKELHRDLTNNRSLLQGLVAHLRPAIYRINQNMGISNPLLEKIESDYSNLFSILEAGVKKIFPEITIPKEEIGYLVMHFGSALYRKDEVHDVSALVICSSGIGTSKILAMKLQQELSEITNIKYISLFEVDEMTLSEYDLIISTIPLTNFNREYILVSPILSDAEVKKIRNYIRTTVVDEEKQKLIAPQEVLQDLKKGKEVASRLSSIQKYTTAIVNILEGFTVVKIEEVDTIAEALSDACNYLYGAMIIKDAKQVEKQLLERETIGGLGIPDTSLALYHTRSSNCLVPSFTIYRLSSPIAVKAMDNTVTEMKTILLMLSPEKVTDESLDVLSYISSLIIQNDESIKMFESSNQEDLFSYLSTHLEKLFEEKLKEIRSV